MLSVVTATTTAYDALRAHLARKPVTPSANSSARWRPYSRKAPNTTTDDSYSSQTSLPTPEDSLPQRRATKKLASATVQDPEGLIEYSLSLLTSVYDGPMAAFVSRQQPSYATNAMLPTPPASPTPMQVYVPRIAPEVMHWFIVELLRRSHTSAAVIRAALAYIDTATPLIRAAIDNADSDPESPLLDPRRVYLAAIILGSKFLLDRTYTNKTWAAVSGLDALEVGRCERALGKALDWRLWVGGPGSTEPSS